MLGCRLRFRLPIAMPRIVVHCAAAKMNSTRASIKRLEIQLATGAVAAALSVACGGSSTTAPSTTPVTLHGEVSDPIGDAVSVAGISHPPDLVHGTG
jgi:hypothetical protein